MDPTDHWSGWINKAKKAVKKTARSVKKRAYKTAKRVVRGAIKRGTSAVRTVKKAVSNGYNKVKNFTNRTYNRTNQYVVNTKRYVANTSTKYRGKVKDAYQENKRYVKQRVKTAYEKAVDSGKTVHDWGKTKLRESFNVAKNWTESLDKTMHQFCTTDEKVEKQKEVRNSKKIPPKLFDSSIINGVSSLVSEMMKSKLIQDVSVLIVEKTGKAIVENYNNMMLSFAKVTANGTILSSSLEVNPAWANLARGYLNSGSKYIPVIGAGIDFSLQTLVNKEDYHHAAIKTVAHVGISSATTYGGVVAGAKLGAVLGIYGGPVGIAVGTGAGAIGGFIVGVASNKLFDNVYDKYKYKIDNSISDTIDIIN